MSVLRLEQVTKSFQDGEDTIVAPQPTDFSLEAGEFMAVIGPSGSGKSTFLTLAGGLQTPTAGRSSSTVRIILVFLKRNGPNCILRTLALSCSRPT